MVMTDMMAPSWLSLEEHSLAVRSCSKLPTHHPRDMVWLDGDNEPMLAPSCVFCCCMKGHSDGSVVCLSPLQKGADWGLLVDNVYRALVLC